MVEEETPDFADPNEFDDFDEVDSNTIQEDEYDESVRAETEVLD